jgi:XTP/dITP diphosphohydrolase
VDGAITTKRHGVAGFGYDPVFVPRGYSSTFSEMGETEKNKISHRALAVEKFNDFLKSAQG